MKISLMSCRNCRRKYKVAFVEDGVFVGTIEQSKVSIKDSLEDVNLVSSELKEILDLDE